MDRFPRRPAWHGKQILEGETAEAGRTNRTSLWQDAPRTTSESWVWVTAMEAETNASGGGMSRPW